MIRTGTFIAALLFLVGLFSCNTDAGNSTDSRQADSLEILSLLQKMYKWHEANYPKIDEFPIIVKDTLQVGIDTGQLVLVLSELRSTGFFADTFLRNIEEMNTMVDTTLRNATVKYYNEINFNFQDDDPWINAQDYSDKYWDSLDVGLLNISGDNASLVWRFHDTLMRVGYLVNFKRVNGSWKISAMAGFNKFEL